MKNVLIAANEIELRETISSFLMESGHTTFSTDNGKEALAIFIDKGEEFWKAMIADFELSDLNGAELIAEVRKIAPSCPMKVILVTSFNPEAKLLKILNKDGPFTVLPKPCDCQMILDVINTYDPNFGRVTIVD